MEYIYTIWVVLSFTRVHETKFLLYKPWELVFHAIVTYIT